MSKLIYYIILITLCLSATYGNYAGAEENSVVLKGFIYSASLPFAILLALVLAGVIVILRNRVKSFEKKVVASHDILEVTLDTTKREVERVRQACELVSLAYYEYDVAKGVFTGDKGFYLTLVGEMRPYLELEEILSHVHPEDRIHLGAYTSILNGEKTDETVKVEGRIYDANGDLRYMRVFAKSYYDANGNLSSRRGSMLDITEEKKKEMALLRINSQFEYVQKMAKIYCWEIVKNKPGYIKISKEFFKLAGEHGNSENIMPLSFFKEILSEDDYHTVIEGIGSRSSCSKSFEAIVPLYPKDGSEARFIHLILFSDIDNPYIEDGVKIGVIHDITELKKAERRIGQSEKMKALGRLASGIAHDFNNQLSGILGFAELIRTEEISDTVAEYNNMIIDRGEKSAELIRRLLDFSRNQSEDAELIDVDELIADTVAFFSHLIGKSVILKKDIAENGLGVLGSYNELQNALLNLGINSRDSLDESNGKIVFGVSSKLLSAEEADKLHLNVGRFVIISVQDNGHGMTDEVKEKALEPFFTTKPQGKGTGLGLSTVHGMMSSLAGGMDIQSRVGAGTTVSLYLPEAPGDMIKETRKKKKVNELKLGVGNVLLIDDDKTLVKLVTLQLEKAGYAATGINEPLEAVKHYRENHEKYDLVILDMIMPDMNGAEVFKELKSINNNVKTIIMTGYSDEDLFEQARDEGIEYFLKKPVTFTALTRMVAEVLGSEAQESNNEI